MRVGILGSGLMGGKLGTLFASAGHEVVFSYARGEQKLKRFARETHIAIQEDRDGKTVEWTEKVSDEQYRAGLGAE